MLNYVIAFIIALAFIFNPHKPVIDVFLQYFAPILFFPIATYIALKAVYMLRNVRVKAKK